MIKTNNNWQVRGALTFKSIVPINQLSLHQFNKVKNELQLSLDKDHTVDSAGIAWLLQTIEQCKQNKIKLSIIHLNKNAQSLAIIYGVIDIITPYLINDKQAN